MKKQGISVIGIIVLVGLIASIVWGLNYIITKDFVTVRPPTPKIPSRTNIDDNTVVVATSTPIATTTPAVSKPPVVTTPKPATDTSSALTVTYTDKGFTPAILSVKKGQTVTFVNNSSAKLWVSANPSPSASDYPAFNQKTGIANGASWTFTFEKTGTWFYHNHYSPAKGAKIVVSAK